MIPMLYASDHLGSVRSVVNGLTLDPLANKYYGISPYAFCANNPINCVDPDEKFVGTAMDLGVHSMVKNIQAGNLRAAFLKKLLNSALIRTRL
jgi:hypothetical protein